MKRVQRTTKHRILRDVGVLLLVAVVALGLRAWVLAIYVIPSASMMPALLAGDYLLVERWRFALRHDTPRRGEIIVFHGAREDYAKRVIGLPGDRIALRGGGLVTDGRAVPRWRIADLIVPIRPNTPCAAVREAENCRYQRYREMLPGGRLVDMIDLGARPSDEAEEITVPPDHLFVLGDNRDQSEDSRWPAPTGTGLVPIGAVIGTPAAILLSVDGSARTSDPHSWWAALRPDRTGVRF